jgi:hypothetical protein
MRTDRRADMTNLVVAFRNFGKAPKHTEISNAACRLMCSVYWQSCKDDTYAALIMLEYFADKG